MKTTSVYMFGLLALLGMALMGCEGDSDNSDSSAPAGDDTTAPADNTDYGIYAGTWTGTDTTVTVQPNGQYTCIIQNSLFPVGDPNNVGGVTTRSSTLKDNRFWIEAQDGTGYDVVFTDVDNGYVSFTGTGWTANLVNNH